MEGKYERMLNKRIANKETEDKKSVSTYANVGRYINEKKRKKRRKTCQCHTDKISKKSKKVKTRVERKKRRKRNVSCNAISIERSDET